jgi:hypothetical protein
MPFLPRLTSITRRALRFPRQAGRCSRRQKCSSSTKAGLLLTLLDPAECGSLIALRADGVRLLRLRECRTDATGDRLLSRTCSNSAARDRRRRAPAKGAVTPERRGRTDFGRGDRQALGRQPLERQCSHARTSRSTAGSVQRERQLSVAAPLASTRVLARRRQALGARFGDEWAPARLGAQARPSPKPGLARGRAGSTVCVCKHPSVAPVPSLPEQPGSLIQGDRNVVAFGGRRVRDRRGCSTPETVVPLP